MRLKLPAIAPGREAQVSGQVPANLLVVPLVDFTAAGKNGKSSMPVPDFVTLQVTRLVGDNTIVAAVIPPSGDLQHWNHIESGRGHRPQSSPVLRQLLSVSRWVAEYVREMCNSAASRRPACDLKVPLLR
jgi:hypothetical protein